MINIEKPESIGYQSSIEKGFDVLGYKHGTHDQSSHGRRGGGGIAIEVKKNIPLNKDIKYLKRDLDKDTLPYIKSGATQRIESIAGNLRYQAIKDEGELAIIRRSISEPNWRTKSGIRADAIGAEAFNFGHDKVMTALDYNGKVPKDIQPVAYRLDFSIKSKEFGKWLDSQLPRDLDLKRNN